MYLMSDVEDLSISIFLFGDPVPLLIVDCLSEKEFDYTYSDLKTFIDDCNNSRHKPVWY
ncbi:hypothetical protein IGI49_001137 [Enterococcus sp. AZ071]|uniref:hypothetical protein n=1 Tax=Enterococcus sp. AZ071 TaxID=2774641 RepID=UPI003D2D0AE4